MAGNIVAQLLKRETLVDRPRKRNVYNDRNTVAFRLLLTSNEVHRKLNVHEPKKYKRHEVEEGELL